MCVCTYSVANLIPAAIMLLKLSLKRDAAYCYRYRQISGDTKYKETFSWRH